MVRWIFRVMILGCYAAALNLAARGQVVDVSLKVVVRNGPHSDNPKMTVGVPDVVVWLSPLQPLSSIQLSSSHGPYRLVQKN